MGKKIAISIMIILAAALAVLFWQNAKKEKKMEAVYIEMDEEIRPISLQIYDLETQISDLKNKASTVRTGTGTVQFLITDLSTESYDKIINPMSAYSYPVVLGLSLDEMPGQEGCMTTEQATALTEQGWSFCYAYQANEAESIGEEDSDILSAWIEQVRNRAAQAGFDVEPAVYFPSGSYQKEYASTLKAQSIQMIIHHGELGNDLLTATNDDGLWYVGSVWWRRNEILDNKLSTIDSKGGELVALLGIDSSADSSLQDWMGQFDSIIGKTSIEMTGFSDMAAIQEVNLKAIEEEAAGDLKQAEELARQKEELEQKKDEIVSRYMEEMGDYR